MHPERRPADENYRPNVGWALGYLALGLIFFVFIFIFPTYWIGHVIASMGSCLLAYKYARLAHTQYRLKKVGEMLEHDS